MAGTHPLFHFFTPLLLLIHHDWLSGWVSQVDRQRMWLTLLQTDYTAPTGLIGTAMDLARFGQAFLAGGELEGHRILSAAAIRQMLDEGHGGDGPGFGAQLALFPAQHMVVVLANDMLIDRVGLTQRIAATFQ